MSGVGFVVGLRVLFCVGWRMGCLCLDLLCLWMLVSCARGFCFGWLLCVSGVAMCVVSDYLVLGLICTLAFG